MYIWLVTVRAADGEHERVRSLLLAQVLPLLESTQACQEPRLAACIHCAGEHTYLGYWPDEPAVLAFEASLPYQALQQRLAPLLRVPPKRELWEVLSRTPAAPDPVPQQATA